MEEQLKLLCFWGGGKRIDFQMLPKSGNSAEVDIAEPSLRQILLCINSKSKKSGTPLLET